MAKISPTQRSLKELRKRGYTVAIVERWNPFAKIRQDLFGFIDLLAIKKGEILGVQTTSAAHHADHKLKCLASVHLRTWLEAGGKCQVWSWALQGKKGKKKLWTLREETINYE